MSDPSLSIKDIAALYSISISTVRREIKRGKLKPYRVGNQLRFDKKEVEQAFRSGKVFSGEPDEVEKVEEWAQPLIQKWSAFVKEQIGELEPDHVILLDRRGAKIWTYLGLKRFVWGKNLWHSNALTCMTPYELGDLFGGKKVVIFDEMIQRGEQLYQRKQNLSALGASVQSIVLLRRRSFLEKGDLKDLEAIFCEDLGENDFPIRAVHISELLDKSYPPLDVDHLVLKAQCGLEPADLLEKLSSWGSPYVVWVPDTDNGIVGSVAMSLDRPQFFDTNGRLNSGLKVLWHGPCKMRLYLDRESKTCYCSFIAFPSLSGREQDWQKAFDEINSAAEGSASPGQTGTKSSQNNSGWDLREYVASREFVNFALNMFRDFVNSGVVRALKMDFEHFPVDSAKFQGAFGPELGNWLSRQVRGVIASADTDGTRVLMAKCPPPERIRAGKQKSLSFDELACREDLFRVIKTRYDEKGKPKVPIRFDRIYGGLSTYAQSTVAKVLDHELDRGTAKPMNYVRPNKNGQQSIVLSRSFYRGEFDIYSGKRDVVTSKDHALRRTLGLCPEAMSLFLEFSGQMKLTRTQFERIFVNLYHDLTDPKQRREGKFPDQIFLLTWMPDERGRPTAVAAVDRSNPELRLADFLVQRKYAKLLEGEQSLAPLPSSRNKPWESYFTKLKPQDQTSLSALVRFYSILERDTVLGSICSKSTEEEFKDPLFVLASVRDPKTCYTCCWENIESWMRWGRSLFRMPLSPQDAKTGLATLESCTEWISNYLKAHEELVPKLRERMALLQRDYDGPRTVLAVMDENKEIDSSKYPLPKMNEAIDVIRHFNTFASGTLKEIVDPSKKSRKPDGSKEIEWLVNYCPEPKLEKALRRASDSISSTDLRIESLMGSLNIISGRLQVEVPSPKPVAWKALTALISQGREQERFRAIEMNDEKPQVIVGFSCTSQPDDWKSCRDPRREILEILEKRLEPNGQVYPPSGAQDGWMFTGTDPNKILKIMEEVDDDLRPLLKTDLARPSWIGDFHDGCQKRGEGATKYSELLRPLLEPRGDFCFTKELYDKLSQKNRKRFTLHKGLYILRRSR